MTDHTATGSAPMRTSRVTDASLFTVRTLTMRWTFQRISTAIGRVDEDDALLIADSADCDDMLSDSAAL